MSDYSSEIMVLVDSVWGIRSVEDIDRFYDLLCTTVSCSSLMISAFEGSDTQNLPDTKRLFTPGMNNEWREIYFNEELWKDDPVVPYCLANPNTIQKWSDAYSENRLYDNYQKQRSFRNKALLYGMDDGLCLFSTGDAIENINVSVAIGMRFPNDKTETILRGVMPYIARAFNRPGFLKAPRLTEMEHKVLSLEIAGKRHVDVAKALSVSERTVKFHMGNIYSKFEVTNKQDLLGKVKLFGFSQV